MATNTKAHKISKKKDRPLTDAEIEEAARHITFINAHFDTEEEAKIFRDLTRQLYEDTIQYEQENKKRRRG